MSVARQSIGRPALFVVIVGFLTLLFGELALFDNPFSRKTVVVAVAYPRTGDDSTAGQDLRNGYEAAKQKFINETNGIIGDYHVEIKFHDDRTSENHARQVARQITADPRTVVSIGHYSSPTTENALSVYRAGRIPLLIPIASQSDLINNTFYPEAYRVSPPNYEQANTIVRYAVDILEKRNIYIVYGDRNYSKTLSGEIQRALSARGLREIGSSPLRHQRSDFNDIITEIGNISAVDAIIFVGYGREAAIFSSQVRRRGIMVPIVASDGAYGKSFPHYLPSVEVDSVFVVYQGPPECLLEERDQWKEYVEQVDQLRLSSDPTGWSAWAYDALSIALDVIQKASIESKYISRGSVHDVLSGKNNDGLEHPYIYAGALHDHSFSGTNENQNGQYYAYLYSSGEFTQVNN